MSERTELAAKLFRTEGYNCAQAVLCAFGDLTGMDGETAIRVASSFGGGIGRLREVCGAVSGALMALGLLAASDDPADRAAKAAHYRRVQALAQRFREENGSIICRELLEFRAAQSPVPEERTPEYYSVRPCERMVMSAAGILEEILAEMAE